MDVRSALERLFPFARVIEVLETAPEDGSFIAEMMLPVRAGESVVQLYRFPQNLADELPWEDRLQWRGPRRRSSFGEGRWGFLASWDGVASLEELRALVSSRVVRDPELGDPDA